MDFRKELFELGLSGFQWLDGSFLEDIEAQAGRDPGDIDVVTFASNPMDLHGLHSHIHTSKPWLLNRKQVKSKYSVDHFLVALASRPELIVDQTRYWYGLFSHRRDAIWKGMLVLRLEDSHEDISARAVLGGKA